MVDGVSASVDTTPLSGSFVSGQMVGSGPTTTVDGTTHSLLSIDAMQEFQIQTSSYSESSGRQPGGQVSIISKSGANEFHGSLFEYLRNEVLDATEWFTNANDLDQPPLRLNDFGGTLGGPIVKDKTFFFFSYEGQRLRLPETEIGFVPSLSFRNSVDPSLRPLLDAFPLPTGADLGNGDAEYAASRSSRSTTDAASIKIDHVFNDQVRLFGRYSFTPSEAVRPRLAESRETEQDNQTVTVGTTWALSPRVINDLRFNWTRATGAGRSSFTNRGGAQPPPESALLPSFTSLDDATSSVQVRAGSTHLLNAGRSTDNLNRQINLVETFSFSRSSHQLELGVDYRYLYPRYEPASFSLGLFFRSPADLMTSPPQIPTVRLGAAETSNWSIHNFSLFAQDTWRVTPRLTLTYGLRWELVPAPSASPLDLLIPSSIGDFLTAQAFDSNTVTFAPPGASLWDTDFNNLAPRVGVAYSLSQRSGWETVLRGGFGVYYDLGLGGAIASAAVFPYERFAFLGGFTYFPDESLIAPPPLDLQPQSAISLSFMDPALQTPYTRQWSVAFQQALGASQVLTATYVGSAAEDLLAQQFRNDLANSSLTRAFRGLAFRSNYGTSDYHALQLQFRRRFSRGLQALVNYTWSKSIDEASQNINTFGQLPTANLPPETNRGPSNFDVRHILSGAISYDIPAPFKSPVARAILGNWGVDTVFKAQSGKPVNIIYQGDIGFGASSALRPDLVSGVPLLLDDPDVPAGRRLNPAAFDVQTPFGDQRQGTLGRNAVRNLGLAQVDFSVRRRFPLSERINLEFRSEFFNIFNHPNFGPYNTFHSFCAFFGCFGPFSGFGESFNTLNRTLGGVNSLFQVGGPRSIQFALKLVF